ARKKKVSNGKITNDQSTDASTNDTVLTKREKE
ncbi:MAG: hypothetical protein MOP50_408, partial [Nitrososphaera sp.]|nr:hypothetical protein [Nitrososphaera sp.]